MCGSRKYPYPLPPQKELEIFQRGGGGSPQAQENPERGGRETDSIIPIIMLNFRLFAFSYPSRGRKINSTK